MQSCGFSELYGTIECIASHDKNLMVVVLRPPIQRHTTNFKGQLALIWALLPSTLPKLPMIDRVATFLLLPTSPFPTCTSISQSFPWHLQCSYQSTQPFLSVSPDPLLTRHQVSLKQTSRTFQHLQSVTYKRGLTPLSNPSHFNQLLNNFFIRIMDHIFRLQPSIGKAGT